MEVDLDSSFESLECFKVNTFEENSLLNELYEELYSKSQYSFGELNNTKEDCDGNNSVDVNNSEHPIGEIAEAREAENMQKSGIPTKGSPRKIPSRDSSPSAMASGGSPSGIPMRKGSTGIPTRSPSASPTAIPRGIPRKGSTSSSGSSTRNSARNSREGSPSGIPTRGSPRLSRGSDDEAAGSPRRSCSGIPMKSPSGIGRKTPPGSPRSSGSFTSSIPARGSPVLSGIPRKAGKTDEAVLGDSDDDHQTGSSTSRTTTESLDQSQLQGFQQQQQAKDSPTNIPSGIPMRTSRFSSPIHTRNQSMASSTDTAESEYHQFETGLPAKESGVTPPTTSTPKRQVASNAEIMEMKVEDSNRQQEVKEDMDSDGDSQMMNSVIIHSSCDEDEDFKFHSSMLCGTSAAKSGTQEYNLLSRCQPAPVDQEPDQCVPQVNTEKYEEKTKKDETPKKSSPLDGYVYRPYGDDSEEREMADTQQQREECISPAAPIVQAAEYQNEVQDAKKPFSADNKEVMRRSTDDRNMVCSPTEAVKKPAGEAVVDKMQTSTLSSMFDSTETYKSNGEEFDAMVRANMTGSMTASVTSPEPSVQKMKQVVEDENIDVSVEGKTGTIIMKVGDIIGDNVEEFNVPATMKSPEPEAEFRVIEEAKQEKQCSSMADENIDVSVEENTGTIIMKVGDIVGDSPIPEKKPVNEETGVEAYPELKKDELPCREETTTQDRSPVSPNFVQTERAEMFMEKSDDEEDTDGNGQELNGFAERETKMADNDVEEVVETRKQIEINPRLNGCAESETKMANNDVEEEVVETRKQIEIKPSLNRFAESETKMADNDVEEVVETRKQIEIKPRSQIEEKSVFDNETYQTERVEQESHSLLSRVRPAPVETDGNNWAESRTLSGTQSGASDIGESAFDKDGHVDEPVKQYGQNIKERKNLIESQISNDEKTNELSRCETPDYSIENVTETRKQIEIKSEVPEEQMTRKTLNPMSRDVFDGQVPDKQTHKTVKETNARGEQGLNPAGIRELESMYQEFETQVDDFLCFAESNLRGSADSEDAHVEVLKEEDKLDDGIESVPSIRNLKSRFETKDSTPPPLPTDHSTKIRSRSPYGAGGRTPSGDEDQVGYMSYTQSNHSDYIDNTEDATPRRVSKWDKPKEAPPPPVNREGAEEEAVESELPAIGTSRSMAARFQQQQSETQAERKPVRRITPPREELRRTIEDSDIQYDSDVVRSGDTNGQEELPPAEYTRSMLAKFRSIENTGAPAPSPVRSAQISNQVRRTQTTTYQQHRQPVNRPSPDSGISDSESQNVNGDDGGVAENNPLVLSDVVREADRHHEEELPETGTTRSLLAQWRNMEQTVQKQGSATTEHLRPKSQTRQWSVNTPGSAGRQGYNGGGNNQYDRTDSTYDEDREVIRADDNVEDELPAPSTTRNMLARFQEMQEEAQREASNLKTPPPSKKVEKQFKWTVKEAKPLFKGRRDSGPIDANGYHEDGVDYQNGDVTHHHGDQDADSSDDQVWRQNEDVVRADQPVEEEMPAPETTRSMLAMFKSMEDVNRPPPTPEHAQKAVKQSTPMRTASIHRGSSTSSHGRSSHYSNHVNGHDSDGGGDGYHSDDREAGGYLSNGSHDDLNRGYDRYGGEFENDPQRNPDVVREDTANETEVLPEQGTTKNLLAKFQALQAI